MADSERPVSADEHVERLADFFLEHPVWQKAAGHVRDGSTSNVFFSHLPGERFHLLRSGGKSLLRSGGAPDPDFVFRFTPRSIDRIAAVGGDVGDFAVELFTLVLAEDDELQVGLRIAAPLPRLIWRGYVALVLAGGPRLAAFGAERGVGGLADLRRLVKQVRSATPEAWEAS